MYENLFEAARYLEKILRETNEYKNFRKLCVELNMDPNAKRILNQLNDFNARLQQKQIMGQEIKQQELESLENLEAAAQRNSKIKQFLEADFRVNRLLFDLNRIIAKPLNELYSQLIDKSGNKK